jgi:hypothetical protein
VARDSLESDSQRRQAGPVRERDRGLRAIQQLRRQRGVERRHPSLGAVVAGLVIVLLGAGAGQWVSEAALRSERVALLARQRELRESTGSEWARKDRWAEQELLALAKRLREEGPVADPALALQPSERWLLDEAQHKVLANWDFRSQPGVYVRIDALRSVDSESLRANILASAKDAVVACLMTAPNADQWQGRGCERSRDCVAGELCNSVGHCSVPAQPLNLKEAGFLGRVLGEEWSRDVERAGSTARLRVLRLDLESQLQEDLPWLSRMARESEYLYAVVDQPQQLTAALWHWPSERRVLEVDVSKKALEASAKLGSTLLGTTPPGTPAAKLLESQASGCVVAQAFWKAWQSGNQGEKEMSHP